MTKKLSVEITMPVYNEEAELEKHITKLHRFCTKNLNEYDWHITIADNNSIDNTNTIGKKLETAYNGINIFRLPEKGRGRAVKAVWVKSNADICCYMDIDLSTNLSHIPQLISSVKNGSDITIGSRLRSRSKVINRSFKRELISRSYNLLIKVLFQTKFSDAQCGFKAVNRKVVHNLIPIIQDNEWFTDSELLIIGEKAGYIISEIPVVWQDDPGSTVRVLPTALGDLKGLYRLFITRPWRKISSLHERQTTTRN